MLCRTRDFSPLSIPGRGNILDVLKDYLRFLTPIYLLLVICSTTDCQPTSSNPLPADNSTFKVSELSFSDKLRNPCALIDASRLQQGNLSQENRATTRRTVVNEMNAKSELIRECAETILKTNVLQDCTTLELPAVAVIPSDEDLTNNRSLEVLRLFYTSLLNHTAHVYFISEQLQRHSADSTCNSPELSTNARLLASHMRELMCVLRIAALTLEPQDEEDNTFVDSTEQILNEELVDQPLCSRRSVRDCQTVGSTVNLLRQLSNYLQNAVLISDSSDPSTTSC